MSGDKGLRVLGGPRIALPPVNAIDCQGGCLPCRVARGVPSVKAITNAAARTWGGGLHPPWDLCRC